MKKTTLPITGKTPTGRGFILTELHLEFTSTEEIGSIGIPLKPGANHEKIAFELSREGIVSESTRKQSFAC